MRPAAPIQSVEVGAFDMPMDAPEADGTETWDATTLVTVHVRARVPPGMDVAAGEYGYRPIDFRRILDGGAVDVLQADATRCLGVTGFMAAARVCESFAMRLSAHTAPSAHCHLACAATPLVHTEYFHDHVRIEQLWCDGFVAAAKGMLRPDRSRPGLGVELKEADAARHAV